MNQFKYKQSQALTLDLNQTEHINIISKKAEAEVGLEGVGGREEPAKRPKEEGSPDTQWQCPAQHCPQVRVSHSEDGCLRPSPPAANKPFFQTLDREVQTQDAPQV